MVGSVTSAVSATGSSSVLPAAEPRAEAVAPHELNSSTGLVGRRAGAASSAGIPGARTPSPKAANSSHRLGQVLLGGAAFYLLARISKPLAFGALAVSVLRSGDGTGARQTSESARQAIRNIRSSLLRNVFGGSRKPPARTADAAEPLVHGAPGAPASETAHWDPASWAKSLQESFDEMLSRFDPDPSDGVPSDELSPDDSISVVGGARGDTRADAGGPESPPSQHTAA